MLSQLVGRRSTKAALEDKLELGPSARLGF